MRTPLQSTQKMTRKKKAAFPYSSRRVKKEEEEEVDENDDFLSTFDKNEKFNGKAIDAPIKKIEVSFGKLSV